MIIIKIGGLQTPEADRFTVGLGDTAIASFWCYKDTPLADILREAARAIDQTTQAKQMADNAITQAMKQEKPI